MFSVLAQRLMHCSHCVWACGQGYAATEGAGQRNSTCSAHSFQCVQPLSSLSYHLLLGTCCTAAPHALRSVGQAGGPVRNRPKE